MEFLYYFSKIQYQKLYLSNSHRNNISIAKSCNASNATHKLQTQTHGVHSCAPRYISPHILTEPKLFCQVITSLATVGFSPMIRKKAAKKIYKSLTDRPKFSSEWCDIVNSLFLAVLYLTRYFFFRFRNFSARLIYKVLFSLYSWGKNAQSLVVCI